jgi:hypothetical protein
MGNDYLFQIMFIVIPIAIFLVFFCFITLGFKAYQFFNKKQIKKNIQRDGGITSQNKLPISWTITPIEGIQRSINSIKVAFLFFVPASIYVAIEKSENTRDLIHSLPLAVFPYVVIFLVAYVVKYIIKEKNRNYQLTDKIVKISKGQQSKEYTWEDFEYFYIHPDDVEYLGSKDREKYVLQLRNIRGIRFYLKLKSINLYSKIILQVVTIYSEPDNYNKIKEILEIKLTKGNPIYLWLVNYKFD